MVTYFPVNSSTDETVPLAAEMLANRKEFRETEDDIQISWEVINKHKQNKRANFCHKLLLGFNFLQSFLMKKNLLLTDQ